MSRKEVLQRFREKLKNDPVRYAESRKKQDAWREQNKEHVNAMARERNAKNPDICKAKRKRYYIRNHEKCLIRGRVVKIEKKDKIKVSSKKYFEENKEVIRKRKRDFERNKKIEIRINHIYAITTK